MLVPWIGLTLLGVARGQPMQTAASCPTREVDEQSVGKSIVRHLRAKDLDERLLVAVYDDLSCLALGELPRFVDRLLEARASSSKARLRKAELAMMTLDYAGRQLSRTQFANLAELVAPRFTELLEQERLHVARGSFVEQAPEEFVAFLIDVSPDDVVDSMRTCGLQAIRSETASRTGPSSSGSREGSASGVLCPVASRGSGTTGGEEARESASGGLVDTFTSCIEAALDGLDRGTAVCVGGPDLGPEIGFAAGQFCDVAGSRSLGGATFSVDLGRGWVLRPKGEASVDQETGKLESVSIGASVGPKTTLPSDYPGADKAPQVEDARQRYEQSKRNADEAFSEYVKSQAELKQAEAKLEAARKDAEAAAKKKSPVLQTIETEEVKSAKAEVEQKRNDAEQKETDWDLKRQQAETDRRELEQLEKNQGNSLCESYAETCRDTCSAGEASPSPGASWGIGFDGGCAAGRKPLDPGQGTTDPPDAEPKGGVYEAISRCMLGIGSDLTVDASPEQCALMVCGDGRVAAPRDGECSCDRSAPLPPEVTSMPTVRCNQQIQCQEGSSPCTCPLGGGRTRPVLPDDGGTTFAALVALEGPAGGVTVVPVALEALPVAIRGASAPDIEDPHGALGAILPTVR